MNLLLFVFRCLNVLCSDELHLSHVQSEHLVNFVVDLM